MSNAIVNQTVVERAILPAPRFAVTVRPAVSADYGFVDQLQRMHAHMVGWASTTQLHSHIDKGEMLVADYQGCPMGYLIAKDRYKGQDQCGIIYQLNVVPLKQRHLIGANLVEHFFAAAPYGMRLCCCWCAQDLQANYFWESVGFVPLAFRTGSRSKQRIHIFWQGRTKPNDATPWWFPSSTTAGAVREDRLVIPIPPGASWKDCKPVILPGPTAATAGLLPNGLLPPGMKVKALPPPPISRLERMKADRLKSKILKIPAKGCINVMTSRGIKQVRVQDEEPIVKVKKPAAPRFRNDPLQAKQSRELRDRFMEAFNGADIQPVGKYLLGSSGQSRSCLDAAALHSNPAFLLGAGDGLQVKQEPTVNGAG